VSCIRSAAANQLLAYGAGYGRDYDTSAYNCSSFTAAGHGALVAYGGGYMTAMDTATAALYNRPYDYNSTIYNADCVNQSTISKSKRRVTSSVTSSPPANHGADTCYYKKQRLVGGAGYSYDSTTASSPSAAATADSYCHAFDVINMHA